MSYILSLFYNKFQIIKKSNTSGVATIVATLLTISITVVGGIIVYTFVQEFYVTSQIELPSIEILDIYGYDISNSESLVTHSGNTITLNSNQEKTALENNDAIILHVNNRSMSPVTIFEVQLFGKSYFIDSGTECSTTTPATGQFSLSTSGDENCLGIGFIKPNQYFSIYLRYDDSSNGDVSIGRTFPVTIIAGEGMKFVKHLQNGIHMK